MCFFFFFFGAVCAVNIRLAISTATDEFCGLYIKNNGHLPCLRAGVPSKRAKTKTFYL